MRVTIVLASVLLCMATAFIPSIKSIDVRTGKVKDISPGCMAPIASCLCAANPAALANVTFLAAVVILLIRSSTKAVLLARALLVVSFLLGCSFLLIYNWAVWGDESGVTRIYLRPHYGYFVWLGSFLLCAIATLIPRPPRSDRPTLCPLCGHDVRASKGTCPECGAAIPDGFITPK